ncbi:MAG TPA: helix-turn-helix domain-containing protein [Armatimonadota bacterium]
MRMDVEPVSSSGRSTKSGPDITSIIPEFEVLARKYLAAWGLPLLLADVDGQVVVGGEYCCEECTDRSLCAASRVRALRETLRWGEPSTMLCHNGRLIWAVPVMHNALEYGAIVAVNVPFASPEPGETGLSAKDIRKAAAGLLAMAEQANLTNAALLQSRMIAARRESERAEAIHELKGQQYRSIRDMYMVEEASLIAAIKRGDRRTARGILNRVLVGIYYYGRERPTLLKSFVLELVVTMSRSAVESGADPTELLGANYSSFTDLSRIDSEEDLCAWLVSMLERMMDAIKTNQQYPSSVLLSAALRYMHENLHENLSRDDAASVACLSPSHFSRVVKQTFGYSFTELLSRMRIEKARELLTLTEKSLMQICLECGFSDQSYFTKVFQKYTSSTPGEYRHGRRNSFK